MAVTKAFLSGDKTVSPATARGVGMEIAREIEEMVGGLQEVHVEWIQDEVVGLLRKKNHHAMADAYQGYREKRAKIRQGARKTESRVCKVSIGPRVVEVDGQKWISLLRGLVGGLEQFDWPLFSEVFSDAPSGSAFDVWIDFWMARLLERVASAPGLLNMAQVLYVDAWNVETVGKSSVFDGKEEVEAALLSLGCDLFDSGWAGRFAVPEGLKEAAKTALKSDCLENDWMIGLSGLQQLRRSAKVAGRMDRPGWMHLRFALAVGRDAAGVLAMFKGLRSQTMAPPLSSMQSALGGSLMSPDWALSVEDSTGSIFGCLKKTSDLLKNGATVAVNLSRIRAENSPIRGFDKKSAGLAPVLGLFDATGRMLAGEESQRIRLFLDAWHRDLTSFLEFFESPGVSARAGLILPDAFMRRVMEGANWHQASPSESPGIATKAPGALEAEQSRFDSAVASGSPVAGVVTTPARDVFTRICRSISMSGGPSITFPDAFSFVFGDSGFSPTVKLAANAVLDSDGVGFVPEMGISLAKLAKMDEGERKAALNVLVGGILAMAERDVSILGRKMQRKTAILISLLDDAPEAFIKDVLTVAEECAQRAFGALGIGGAPVMDLAHERKAWMAKNRGGYEEFPSSGGVWRKDGSVVAMFGLSPREEYLWAMNATPSLIDTRGWTRQIRFGGRVFKVQGGKQGDRPSVRAQLHAAARAQSFLDQSQTFDIGLPSNDEREIGEAIKAAWVCGVFGIRRFTFNRADN